MSNLHVLSYSSGSKVDYNQISYQNSFIDYVKNYWKKKTIYVEDDNIVKTIFLFTIFIISTLIS